MKTIYSKGLSVEAGKVLEQQGKEAVKKYFSELQKQAPWRPFSEVEEVLFVKYVASI